MLSCICDFTTIIAAVVAILTLGWYFASRYTSASGLFPLMHIGIPHGFHERDIPDLSGKVAIVTGSNAGLGLATAKHLARKHCRVFITCRNDKKCQETKREILKEVPHALIETSVLELSSLSSVRQWIADIKQRIRALEGGNGAIDMLILNAGVMMCPYQLSEDGIELQFAVNHLAHFLIGTELVPFMRGPSKTFNPRIVILSSMALQFTHSKHVHLSFEALNNPNNYDKTEYYGQSKLANLLFSNALSRRLQAKPETRHIYVNALHPGAVRTELSRHIFDLFWKPISELFEKIFSLFLWDSNVASLTTLFAATSPRIETENIRGKYLVPIARVWFASRASRDEQLQDGLWKFSEELLNRFK